MNASRRRQQHRDQLRRDILDAARQLFIEDGYEGFSMRKLAHRIEYSTATIYLHFNGKQELFDELMQQSFSSLLQSGPRPEETASADPIIALKQGMRRYVTFGLEHPDHYRLAFIVTTPHAGDQPSLKPNAAYEGLVGRVRRCVESDCFAPAAEQNPDAEAAIQLIAQSLWAAAHGVTSLLLQRPQFPWVERERLIQRVIDSAVEGLRARPAAAPEASVQTSRRKKKTS